MHFWEDTVQANKGLDLYSGIAGCNLMSCEMEKTD